MYTVVITPVKGVSSITWADHYIFDPEKECVKLYNEYNKMIMNLEFIADALGRIDFYPVGENDGRPEQSFVRKGGFGPYV